MAIRDTVDTAAAQSPKAQGPHRPSPPGSPGPGASKQEHWEGVAISFFNA